MSNTLNAAPKSWMHKEGKAFEAIFAVGFAVFLVIALVGVLTGGAWRTWLPGAEAGKSLMGGVKAAVYTFMSHLN
jgi:light-harvesting complex 1 beta chain